MDLLFWSKRKWYDFVENGLADPANNLCTVWLSLARSSFRQCGTAAQPIYILRPSQWDASYQQGQIWYSTFSWLWDFLSIFFYRIASRDTNIPPLRQIVRVACLGVSAFYYCYWSNETKLSAYLGACNDAVNLFLRPRARQRFSCACKFTTSINIL